MAPPKIAAMQVSFLYVSQGKIYLKDPGKPARLLESKFGQALIERNNQIQQRNAWKSQGTGARFMSGGLLWRQPDQDSDIPVVINAISRGNHQAEFLYSLSTHEIGGVFRMTEGGADERRLLHTSDFRVGHLSAHPSENKIACVVRSRGGSHIAVMKEDGSELTNVTQGDSLDVHPSWIPDSSTELLFQSSGVARNAAGVSVGVSPAAIEKVNIESGEVTTFLADDHFDFVDPKMADDGSLFCIRKPYVSPRNSFNPLRAALDLVLLPFRLLFAVFQFVNFFTMRYTGNTLVSSSGVRQKQPDLRQMLIMDNLAQASRMPAASLDPGKGWRSPNSWTLVQRTVEGEVRVIEKGVLTFDLVKDGSLIFSDGRRVLLRHPNGSKEELLKDEFISQILAFSPQQ